MILTLITRHDYRNAIRMARSTGVVTAAESALISTWDREHTNKEPHEIVLTKQELLMLRHMLLGISERIRTNIETEEQLW